MSTSAEQAYRAWVAAQPLQHAPAPVDRGGYVSINERGTVLDFKAPQGNGAMITKIYVSDRTASRIEREERKMLGLPRPNDEGDPQVASASAATPAG